METDSPISPHLPLIAVQAAIMTQYAGKRKSDAVDLTETDDGSTRTSKASRTEPSSDPPQDVSLGMRFGESADYIPLPPLSQVAFVDEEEDQANELVQGSQDDALTGNFTLYGMYLGTNTSIHESSQGFLNNITRSIASKDCGRSLLQWCCYIWRACLSEKRPPKPI